MKRSKVFAFSFRYQRSIPRPASFEQNQSMENITIDELETGREIDDLYMTIANLQNQLDFANMQNRSLRVRVNRYERILGMEEQAA